MVRFTKANTEYSLKKDFSWVRLETDLFLQQAPGLGKKDKGQFRAIASSGHKRERGREPSNKVRVKPPMPKTRLDKLLLDLEKQQDYTTFGTRKNIFINSYTLSWNITFSH